MYLIMSSGFLYFFTPIFGDHPEVGERHVIKALHEGAKTVKIGLYQAVLPLNYA